MTKYELLSLIVAGVALAISALSVLWPIINEKIQSQPRITALITGQHNVLVPGQVSSTTTFSYEYDKEGLELEVVFQNTGSHRQSLIGLHTSLEIFEESERSYYNGSVDPTMYVLDAGEAAKVIVHYPLANLPVHPGWCNIAGLHKAEIDSVSVPLEDHRESSGQNTFGSSVVPAYNATVYLWYRLGNQKGFVKHALPVCFIKTSKEFYESVKRLDQDDDAGSNKAV